MKKICEDCLFVEEDRWGALYCIRKMKFIGNQDCCEEWEDCDIQMDAIYRKGEFTNEQIKQLKRETVLIMRRIERGGI